MNGFYDYFIYFFMVGLDFNDFTLYMFFCPSTCFFGVRRKHRHFRTKDGPNGAQGTPWSRPRLEAARPRRSSGAICREGMASPFFWPSTRPVVLGLGCHISQVLSIFDGDDGDEVSNLLGWQLN